MEKPDQLRELFRMQAALNQRIGVNTESMTMKKKSADDVFNCYVKKNEVTFQRQESGYVKKDHDDRSIFSWYVIYSCRLHVYVPSTTKRDSIGEKTGGMIENQTYFQRKPFP